MTWMWQCPVCGQTFVTRNMPHSCQVVALDDHFAGRPAALRDAFDAFVAAARENGPVTLNATKSRITLQVRMRFAAVEPRGAYLRAHLVLKREIASQRLAVEHLPPDYYLHRFTLTGPADVDAELKGWIAEAYAVGAQLTRSRPPADPPGPDRPPPGTR
jgi:uncharacterized protein DUF5655